MLMDEETKKVASFCKFCWNKRVSSEEFTHELQKQFCPDQIQKMAFFFLEELGQDEGESHSLFYYIINIISEDPSIIFADLDLENPRHVIGARRIVEEIGESLFNVLPVYSERSAKSALNALISILKSQSHAEVRRNILKLSNSSYFSILIASGRIFAPEKFKQAQILFKESDPFDGQIFQLPLTQAHLPSALFSKAVHDPHFIDNYRDLFFLFSISPQLMTEQSKISNFISTSVQTSVFVYLLNVYLETPMYYLAHFLTSFVPEHYKGKKTNESDDEILKNILLELYTEEETYKKSGFFTNHEIIHKTLPNGILPTLESAYEFLTRKPDNYNIETIVEDSLKFPSFTKHVTEIYLQKLNDKDIPASVCLTKQMIKIYCDFRITWYTQGILFTVLKAIYEFMKDLTNEESFELVFIFFISIFENCIMMGNNKLNNQCKDFIDTCLDEPLKSLLLNFFSGTNLITTNETLNSNISDDLFEDITETDNNTENDHPINKLMKFLLEVKEKNDFDPQVLIKSPYLLVPAFFWGIKTVHPNSKKLYKIKFPKYRVLKRFFIQLTICHNGNAMKLFEYANFDIMVRFPPINIDEMKALVLFQLSGITDLIESTSKYIQSLFFTWQAWINVYSIEKFIKIILSILVWNDESSTDAIESKHLFHYAGSTLAALCHEDKELMKTAISTIMEFIEEYEGSSKDGYNLASLCILLVISFGSEWHQEFERLLAFRKKLLIDAQEKSMKWSFALQFLVIALYVPEIQKLITIDMFDINFLKFNWQSGIDFFLIQSNIRSSNESTNKSEN
ncbi:hypothetical protein TRFO_14959 [Tritrichomonas foetus]|uniref:Uncharacterized protein n=1 Tax=Tritrichomonas foetus TaxID=1144522 RepID=A0A1J4KTR6_9EUKA|nr:hypothetical protein TRFO_14959 [Tritrichomonas foetus]|eukprot:OHT14651.1 hypothetical protein TRFO_14959 [Tritrichomonas foetus]